MTDVEPTAATAAMVSWHNGGLDSVLETPIGY